MRGMIVVAGLTAMGLVSGGVVPEAQSAAERQQMKAEFLQRVDAYVVLHRSLEQSLPAQIVSRDPEAIAASNRALGKAMRKARARAAQGDIFTPGIAVYLRVVIAETLRREAILDMLGIIEDGNEVRTPARVNGDYPAGRAIPFIPPCLLAALPELPGEVRYSFIGRDLILWDMHAGLIVDFVPRAVPVFTGPCPRP